MPSHSYDQGDRRVSFCYDVRMSILDANYCYICAKDLDLSSGSVPACPTHGPLWALKRNTVNGDALIVNDMNQVLLGKRTHEPNQGCWGISGGFTEYGEHPKATAVREALEETGWEVEVVKLLDVYLDANLGDPNAEYRAAVTYVCRPIKQVHNGDGEAEDLAWFDIHELPDNLNPDHVDPLNDYINSIL